MINNKRGMSQIVSTLIIVLLVLVAIGIVWVVIGGVLEEGTTTISTTSKCLNIDIRATSAVCDGEDCNVTFTRKAGGEEIDGLKLVFKNEVGEASSVIDLSGEIEALATVTHEINTTISNPNSIEVTVYFKDESGTEQLCKQTNSYSWGG